MLTGTAAPKVIFGTNEIALDNVVILKDEPEEDYIIHPSIFTGHREFILDVVIDAVTIKRKYWVVEIKMNLYDLGETAALIFYNNIKQYEGSSGKYYRHSDGDYLKDKNGDQVPMILESVVESYMKTTDFKDLLFLRFKSSKYVDLSQGVT